jgi:putative glutamine amidotransferase
VLYLSGMSGFNIAPVVGIPCCEKVLDGHPFQAVGEKYITGVIDGTGALPWLIPSLEAHIDRSALIDKLDGVLLTGSPSNVEPHHYGGPPAREGVLLDATRDALVLPFIREAVDAGVPVFAICRGFQELNVALGGTLHQHLEEVPGRWDHRSLKNVGFADMYAPRHLVDLAPGGLLASLAGRNRIMVNSLHGQGVDKPAPGVVIEARAPDGTVEAIRAPDAKAFVLGVQWHPEWRVLENPFYTAIFGAFGAAVRARAEARHGYVVPGRVA